MPDRLIHKLWNATPQALADSRLVLGRTPNPIGDRGAARKRALDAFKTIKIRLSEN